MYALIVILGEVSLPNVTISGIGGKFQTHCVVQKVYGLCYCSGAIQGRCCSFGDVAPHGHHRFTALSGMYFSLQYLSLSDAVVLKFLAPILTGFSGTIFLGESLSLKEVTAGCEHFMKCLPRSLFT